MSQNTQYWKGEEELNRDSKYIASLKNEFAEPLPLEEALNADGFDSNPNRRDFLKYFGFSVTAVALAACYRTPVRKAVPYLVKPEGVSPSIADYYSSTCGACSVGCGVEVKVREGRPIKIDGSTRSSISKGGLCATGQASILSLYDQARLANPLVGGSEVNDWSKIDSVIAKQLGEIAGRKETIAIVSNSIHGAANAAVIADFKKKFETTEHVVYDAVSYSGILEANQADFGKAVFPYYNFANAEVIVSFGADFLGTWGSTVEYTKAYSANRVPTKDKALVKHIQFESNMSLTGTNADDRFPMKASNEALHLATLYNKLATKLGAKPLPVAKEAELAGNALTKTADILASSKGKSLVISGSNNTDIQKLVNAINALLENYGKTIDVVNHSNQFKGLDNQIDALLANAKAGKVGAIIFYNTNPVYTGDKKSWEEAIAKVGLTISFAATLDETATLCKYVCPDSHYLESWSDAEPRVGQFHFTQPTISHVFNTRQAQETLLVWSGAAPVFENDPLANKGILNQKFKTSPYYQYIKNIYTAKLEGNKDEAFNHLLHEGVLLEEYKPAAAAYEGTLDSVAAAINKMSSTAGVDMILYQSVGLRDGNLGNNPWLYELPDPVSKVSWDNYVSISKSFSVERGIKEGDTVNIKANGYFLSNVPVIVQPGQANNTIGLAVGFGRWEAGKVGGSKTNEYDSVGHNAYPFVKSTNGNRNYVISNVEVSKGDESYQLAQTQTHHSIEGRNHVKETTFDAWKKDPRSGNNEAKAGIYTIWKKREYLKDGSPNHLWAMAIDLNKCTGCGSCVVSCSIENNVPVVGRDEIRLRREMHWIRIDRYYAFTNTDKQKLEGNFITKEKEIAQLDKSNKEFAHWENVRVVHQPMMCQHCAQAPCETVCPVLATTHSSEGLNQMTYNRCIGTKYCGNNCPYKVRRFNWFRYNDNDKFDFHFNNPLGKMVINPDVTVRTRGVMEKCSFCVQRIQEVKLKAKRENRTVEADAVKTACQRSCPADAIVFGDLHNENSEVSKLAASERGFKVLEELNVQSAITYLTKVRNTETV